MGCVGILGGCGYDMTHDKEHCVTPSTWRRKEGAVWTCDCGKLWRIAEVHNDWEPIHWEEISKSVLRRIEKVSPEALEF